MSESVSSPEESQGENKPFGKHNWRGKLFSADSRFGRAAEPLESTDDDVANFLHPAGTRPEAGTQSAPLPPRIDVAAGSRRPSAANVHQDDTIVDVYRRPKPRQNKGLCVRFDLGPLVIGVGGDEAELPSRDVSRSFADSMSSERSPNRELSHYNTNDQRSQAYGRSTHPYDETSFRPSSLQRRPTGIDDENLVEESRHAGHDREAVQSAFSRTRKLAPRPRNEEQDLDLDFRKREVTNLSYGPSSASEDLSYDQSYTWQTAEFGDQGATRQLIAPPSEALPASALNPSESPEPPYVSQEPSSSSYHFPPATKRLPELPGSRDQDIHHDSQDVPPSLKINSLAIHTAAERLGGDSLEDFDSRVRRFSDLFRLNASAHVNIMAVPLERWVSISAWWFLRGRGGLESALRSKASVIAPATAANDGGFSQAYVNLAKAWWVLKDVTPNLPEIRRFGNASMSSMVAVITSFGYQPLAELVEVHLRILANLRGLTMSMKRNGRLPPDDLQMQGLEPQIFLETPTFSPDIAALMINNTLDPTTKGKNYVAEPFFPVLVGDTARHFSFGKMFVDVCLDTRDDAKSGVQIACVVSVLRERTDWAVKAAVASQDGKVNLLIQSGETGSLHWHDVQWKIPLHTMQLRLAEDICLQIKFCEKDFKTIWGICDYTQRIRKEYSARRDEEALYERELPTFQCFDSPSFPREPIKDCRVRLFERKVVAVEGSRQHRVHDGYRLMVITPPGTKTLSKVSYQLGKESPILFGTYRSKGGNTLLVRVPPSLKVSLTFQKASDVELFRSTLTGTSITEDDHCSAFLQLQNFTISSVSADQDIAYMNASRCINDLKWHTLRVVSKGPPTYGHDSQSTIFSEHLRILADCDSGTFTDRINAGPGDLQLSLSVENFDEIKLLRAAQQDMTWGFADGVLPEADLSSLSHMLQSVGMSPSIRTYHFRSLSDLHSFQAMLTGFHVLYDGLASTFSISRRRFKHWETSTPRLQIIKQDKTVQLVAFFKDFSHGACMNFVLKVTDFFDTFARSGVFFLRIVDAKFALPKGESDLARDFVCLDMPEYPGEHDDIIIGFDNEDGKHLKRLIDSSAKNIWTDQAADRDRFAQHASLRCSHGYKRRLPLRTPHSTQTLRHPSTLAIHADDQLNRSTDVSPALHVSTTFRYASNPDDLVPAKDLKGPQPLDAHVYSRLTAPTSTRLEALLAPLLRAPCLTYSSGLAALHALYVFLKPGRVSIGGGYHGSHGVLGLQRKMTGCAVLPLDCAGEELGPGDVVHLETPVNPTGEAFRIEEYARKAHARGAYLLVDATFGPPGLQDPFVWGADVVMHAGTKYLGGHSDMLCGVLASKKEGWVEELREERTYLGSVMGSLEGWLGVRSLRTLEVRVQRQSGNCQHLVSWLHGMLEGAGGGEAVREAVEKVQHASLQTEDMEWLRDQMPNGYGPVFAVTMKIESLARILPSKLELFHHATSLGGVESLIEWRAMSDEKVDTRLLRISVGLEHWEDLRDDLMRGFQALRDEVKNGMVASDSTA